MRIANDTLIPAGPEDMSTPWVSGAIWIGHTVNYSIQLVFTGVPEGTWRLEASNDRGRQDSGDAYIGSDVQNWTVIAGSSQLIDEAGDHTWAVQNVGYRWVRVRWIPSAGSGSLTMARFNAKGV